MGDDMKSRTVSSLLCIASALLLCTGSARADIRFKSFFPDLLRIFGGEPDTAPDDHASGSNDAQTGKKKRSKKTTNPTPIPQKRNTTSVRGQPNGAASAGAAQHQSSCEKAGNIVNSYGFANVKATNCQGRVYTYSAVRDGKSFAVRIDSVSGELTEVKKAQ